MRCSTPVTSLPYLSQCKLAGGGAKTYLRNKAAQVFSLVFVTDFPDRWPTFLLDLLALSQLGPPAVDAFLRTLLQIDQEVRLAWGFRGLKY